MTKFDPKRKPNPTVCPRDFCFHWEEEGWAAARGCYSSQAEALQNMQPVLVSGCGCGFGRCTRVWGSEGSRDWYEPHEPMLEGAGLPWFYFIPTSTGLIEELQ